MGKNREKSNDLTRLGVNIIKETIRQDGEKVCLCFFPKSSIQALVHLSTSGNILHSKSFIWTDSTEEQIKKMAMNEYKKWKTYLIEKTIENIDDY